MKYRFVVLAEDVACEEFIIAFLSDYATQHSGMLKNTSEEAYSFEQDKKFYITVRDKTAIDKKLKEACKSAFIEYDVHIFFSVRDVDTHEQTHFNKLYANHSSDVPDKYKNRVVITLPVRCIETWLWMIKEQKEAPHSNKNLNNLEKQNDKTAKQNVYGKKHTQEDRKIRIRSICKDVNYSKLKTDSPISFRKFYEDFENVLQHLKQS
ncbi:MAG: hypothetical protein U0Y96_03150 [Candidatus Kapaibacterium sp.]|nr:hypothetical protein [Bacteroidota bacterium]